MEQASTIGDGGACARGGGRREGVKASTEVTEEAQRAQRKTGMWYSVAMKPHPRIRKTIKWGGAVVTVLLVVVWIGSGWLRLSWTSWKHLGGLSAGLVTIVFLDKQLPWGIGLERRSLGPSVGRFQFANDVISRPGVLVAFPQWWLIPGPAIASMVAWRLDTLARRGDHAGRCPRCGYDRAGLPLLAGCPECGSGETNA